MLTGPPDDQPPTEVEVTVPALTRLVGGDRAELSDRELPDLTRTLVTPEDGMGVAGAVAIARTARPRSLLPSSPDHEPLVAAALGDLGINVQHTLQAAGEVDPRSDPTAHVGSALIDEIGIR